MNPPLANNSFYHIYNRGVEKRIIFELTEDYGRFLETLNYYRFHPTLRKLSTHLNFDMPPVPPNFHQKELVKILAFCLMPNHFHLLIQQLYEGGISEFMRRISDSFTRYFNTKHNRVGPLFQGKFKAKSVESDEYLLQLSKYIHRNPLTLPIWKDRLEEYTFSSYPGYINGKRKRGFCNTEIIGAYFINYHNESKKAFSYKTFVEETENIILPNDLLIDSDF